MRTDLYRDPKVCVIADLLMKPDSDLARYVNQHCQCDMTVTRNVMRNVTVGALVAVWGVMRMRGKRINDDLVCRGVTIGVIDDIADVPGFGAAMESVGWAEERAEGLVFPRFFEDYNVDPEASAKEKNAERQRRFRERQKASSGDFEGEESNVTSDVTVTSQSNHREEKRREEKKETKTYTSVPDVAFEKFWETWPNTDRKAAKAKCREKWIKSGFEVKAEEIISHVTTMKAINKSWKEGFEPAPLTYLNQRRWEDGTAASVPEARFEN